MFKLLSLPHLVGVTGGRVGGSGEERGRDLAALHTAPKPLTCNEG